MAEIYSISCIISRQRLYRGTFTLEVKTILPWSNKFPCRTTTTETVASYTRYL